MTQARFCVALSVMAFQSTPSLRKVTYLQKCITSILVISIHTFLAEGDQIPAHIIPVRDISIHTFLAEGDGSGYATFTDVTISIHTFLAEGDIAITDTLFIYKNFNPHLPCGR